MFLKYQNWSIKIISKGSFYSEDWRYKNKLHFKTYHRKHLF